MVKAMIAFLKKPSTVVGIVTALLFQILFPIIWLTAYDHVTDRVDQFKLAIVNEDRGNIGEKVVQDLSNYLSFQVTKVDSLKQAMNDLEQRKYRMVIEIPANFSSLVQQLNQKAPFIFHINESNPTMIKNVMHSVANEVAKAANHESIKAEIEATFEQAHMPANQAKKMATMLSERVVMKIEPLHSVSNFSSSMIPMMVVMACFVGSMMMAMQMQKVSTELKEQFTKWERFSARMLINFASAIIISSIGATLIYSLGDHLAGGFLSLWLFQVTCMLAFLFVAQISLLLLGDAGAWVNIALLSIQLVSSGALIPRELLSPFYLEIGKYLPATYAVDGLMNLVLGGSGISETVASLLWITIGAAILGLLCVSLQRDTWAHSPREIASTK
ncbi:YhgE/Pip domain-containing protein [Aneurinibacillus aneurinilyticus]|uniref:ABC transporter permease n=1 Tax=Aneurinibacillus aneurinilyticus TaxID=1391 RepID=A0A848D0T2_ANEAE|nr:ABC transporter permease [Aneurinibacillus aneurinilyticus]NMF01266.1 ABC transporter permease [Aneurinibacillus aneurinilyticus]